MFVSEKAEPLARLANDILELSAVAEDLKTTLEPREFNVTVIGEEKENVINLITEMIERRKNEIMFMLTDD